MSTLKRGTIAENAVRFGWSKHWVHVMVAHGASKEDAEEGWGPEQEKNPSLGIREWKELRVERLSKKITMGALLHNLEQDFLGCCRMSWSKFLSGKEGLLRYLGGIGFTTVDSIVLPHSSAAIEALRSISLRQIRKLDAAVLGTITTDELEKQTRMFFHPSKHGVRVRYGEIRNLKKRARAEEYFNEDSLFIPNERFPRLTVGDILAINPAHLIEETQTRALLRELGFKDKDGSFMSPANDERERLRKSLIEEEGLRPAEARRFAELAVKRGWICS